MSLQWMEGFETLGTTTGAAGSADVAAGMLRKYGDLKGVSSTAYQLTVPELATGRNGGYSLRARSNSWQNFSHSLGSGNTPTNDTWIIGMAVKFPSFPDDERILIVGRNWGNFNLRLSTTGQIAAGAGYSTILGQTTDPALSTDNWHYIEVKVVVHDTAGSYEIRVDGVTVLSDTNVDTRGGDEDTEIVQFTPQVVDQELDDIYICDIDGTTNNDFLGRVVIEGIFPSADGDASDWTESPARTESTCLHRRRCAVGDRSLSLLILRSEQPHRQHMVNAAPQRCGRDNRQKKKKAPAGLQQAPKRKRRKLETTNIAERPNLRRKWLFTLTN